MLRIFFLTLVAALVFLPTPGRADNWPEFRGPTGQGIAGAGKYPVHWSPTQNVVWKQSIPGAGWSSPVVYGERLYLTTSVPVEGSASNDQSLQTLCLDTATGKTLWATEVIHQDGKTAARIHSKNGHASPTPIVDGQRIYVHFGHQGTACLDLSGKVIWRNTSVKYQPVHGNGGSPILVDDLLVFSCDGGDERFIAALDRRTGKVVWKTPRVGESSQKFSFSTPLLIAVNGHKQIISPGSGVVCAYEPVKGKEIWRVRFDGYSVIPRPVYGHGLVFISTGYNTPSLLAIRPDGHGDVTDTHIAWTLRKSVAHTPCFLLIDDELYMVSDSGVASCLDARTGKVHWQERVGGAYSASPLCANGKIYLQSEQGPAVVLKVGKKFEQLAKNSLGERTLASYAAVDGALFIRTEKHLYRIETR
ncbi:MAG TPA: PQQ-binding-like beta-propeller repeat protein [Gemmataceae bacterium]|nr:PQQ-binding-like beta-propeller repeat protein [Gemmataceae bacterium]